MKNYDDLSDQEKDILREVGNIGGGNAATALASMLAGRVDMSVPNLQIMDVSSVTETLGGPEQEYVGILLMMEGQVNGIMMFLLDKHFTRLLINVLLDTQFESFEHIGEMELSALKEIGNIMAGSYVNAIAALTGLSITITPPQIAIDMAGAILSYPAALFGVMGDKVLCIEEDFMRENEQIRSHLLIMPDSESLSNILKRLGVTEWH
ncbi:chemotaxis protein CheC [Ethanoligenens harbinense]|uniref:CheC, inhibitor of MCP methylation n=1 Tax=Ethanoligenens harbinense (strain DSM 18485 / JCM 12961 / CGMCC 1.5033 / YUAN-3) TaxID=663278 RepID=E6U3K1_ETHHY|nr:chemotaxis protein CheC [Ethanoligenens harbinense]ADU27601.1 CheC, inhibitor of MCP methylation [Ethanoligenens harbinense YUAN-3]AVQ96645.1 chemotaxis protein CheC [Ethanoligenens harbinense YUAN-3]AYF39305.1 chemotaxis protein CheC [Ethanoligenens harbinense]AYF42130.1 chemotaxis protein CheC [Ethanoligenens harbinense]QCN92885.1 chemotaxis protein CheC [Ethanoligenens harbinense]